MLIYAVVKYHDDDSKIVDDKFYTNESKAIFIRNELNSRKSKYSHAEYEVEYFELEE